MRAYPVAVRCWFWLVVLGLAGSVLAMPPTVTVVPNRILFRPGSAMEIQVEVRGSGERVDLYVMLVLPNDDFVAFKGPGQLAGLNQVVPFARGVRTRGESMTVLPRVSLPANLQVGDYTLMAAIFPAGDRLSNLDGLLDVSAIPLQLSHSDAKVPEAGQWYGSSGTARVVLSISDAAAVRDFALTAGGAVAARCSNGQSYALGVVTVQNLPVVDGNFAGGSEGELPVLALEFRSLVLGAFRGTRNSFGYYNYVLEGDNYSCATGWVPWNAANHQ